MYLISKYKSKRIEFKLNRSPMPLLHLTEIGVTSKILSFSIGFMSLIISFGCTHQEFRMKIGFETAGFDAIALVWQTRTSARTSDVTVRIAATEREKICRGSCVDRAQIKFVLNCFELVMDAHLRPYECCCLMTKAIQFIYVVCFYASHLMFGVRQPKDHSITYEIPLRFCNDIWQTKHSCSLHCIHSHLLFHKNDGFTFNTLITVRINNNIL